MGLHCTVCNHAEHAAIDSLLSLKTASQRVIASRYGLKQAAVARHRAHLPPKLAKAIERAEIREGDEFLDGIRKTLNRMSFGVHHGLQAAKDGLIDPDLAYRMVPAMAAQQLRALDLLGQATGRLSGSPASQINVAVVIPQQPPTSPTALPVARSNQLPIIDAED